MKKLKLILGSILISLPFLALFGLLVYLSWKFFLMIILIICIIFFGVYLTESAEE